MNRTEFDEIALFENDQKFCSERGLNRSLICFDRKSNKYKPGDEIYNKKMQMVSMSEFWTSKNFMILDLISTLFLKKFYHCHCPLENSVPKKPQNFYNLENTDYGEISIEISLKNIKRRFTPLKRIKVIDIFHMFKKTIDNEMKIDSYPVRILNEKGKLTTKYINIFKPTQIFTFETKNVEQNGQKVKEIVLEIKPNFNDETRFSESFLENLFNINIDWIDQQFYMIKNEYASRFIRKFLIPNINGKFYKKTYDFKTVCNSVGLSCQNLTQQRQILTKMLRNIGSFYQNITFTVNKRNFEFGGELFDCQSKPK